MQNNKQFTAAQRQHLPLLRQRVHWCLEWNLAKIYIYIFFFIYLNDRSALFRWWIYLWVCVNDPLHITRKLLSNVSCANIICINIPYPSVPFPIPGTKNLSLKGVVYGTVNPKMVFVLNVVNVFYDLQHSPSSGWFWYPSLFTTAMFSLNTVRRFVV